MGLLDLWSDWRKESGYGRDDLTTAGGGGGSGNEQTLQRNYKRGQFPPTDPKYIRDQKTITTPRGRVVKQEGSQLPSADFQSRFKGKKDGKWLGPGEASGIAGKTPSLAKGNERSDALDLKHHGGDQQDQLKWWQQLAGKMNIDFDKAAANWKEKGGFEGLMANPAFTMGLAFMQAGAEGKSLGSGALDNVMKAGGISQHYKKIIEDRKQEPIQATAQDIGEVKGLLKSIGIEEGNIFEKVWSRVTGQGNQQVKFDLAANEIAVQLQKEVRDWQAKNKHPDGTPKIIRPEDKLIILQKLIKDKKVKYKKSIFDVLGISSTIEKDIPKITNYAQGGQIQKGQPAIVGEGGPEYFLPQESGKVLSNDDSRIFAMLLSANPQLQNVSRTRAEKILRNRFPEYFE